MRGGACGAWMVALGLLAGPVGTVEGQVAATPAASTPLPAASGEPLDLNTASVAQLQTLPGIGANYARRIVDGRPYTVKNQLATRGVLPQGAYERIKEYVVAHRATKR